MKVGNMPVGNMQKIPLTSSERKSVQGKDSFDIHQPDIKRMLNQEDKIERKIIGKYILLQIGEKSRFFKIVKVNKNGKECSEGNSPCFKTSSGSCKEKNCCWREDCI